MGLVDPIIKCLVYGIVGYGAGWYTNHRDAHHMKPVLFTILALVLLVMGLYTKDMRFFGPSVSYFFGFISGLLMSRHMKDV